MITRNENDKDVTFFGDDVQDVIRWLEATQREWPENSSQQYVGDYSWDLGASWADTLKLARDGWPEGIRTAEAAAAEVASTARTSNLRYDVAGEMPDVARYCAGDPFHMVSSRHQKQNTPVVHLVVNVICSASVDARRFAEYGGAVAALVDQIENTRRRVELDVIGINTHLGYGVSRCGWKVKRADEPLDLAAVAFGIAHPAAYRRIMCAMWERLPRNMYTEGYGSVASLTQPHAAHIDAADAVLLDGVGASKHGVSVAELNRRLARNVEKALGIQILANL